MSGERLSKLQKQILIYIYKTMKKAKQYPDDSWGWVDLLKTSKIEICHALRPDLKLPTRMDEGFDCRTYQGKAKQMEHIEKAIMFLRAEKLKVKDGGDASKSTTSNEVNEEVDKEPTLSDHFTWKLHYKLTESGKRIASHFLNVEFVGGGEA